MPFCTTPFTDTAVRSAPDANSTEAPSRINPYGLYLPPVLLRVVRLLTKACAAAPGSCDTAKYPVSFLFFAGLVRQYRYVSSVERSSNDLPVPAGFTRMVFSNWPRYTSAKNVFTFFVRSA